jgi:glycine C-acetyltransferase
MSERLDGVLKAELACLKEKHLYHHTNVLQGQQAARVKMDGREIVMLSSNNYLGLANHPKVIEGAKAALDKYGNGAAAVRFICGTLDLHKRLEEKIAEFVGTESALLYISAMSANQGLIPALMDEQDAVFSDALNHASIIDGIRLSKARRHVYSHGDMGALEKDLGEDAAARLKMVVTDGVFSMEGDTAKLPDIARLAAKSGAFTVVDDSHATGVLGKTGRGSPEHFGVKIDVITGTLGKALGGSCGGFVAGSAALVEYLTQKSRPYIFSNALPPAVLGGALAAMELVAADPGLRDRLWQNTRYFRKEIERLGFHVLPGEHPIVPVIVGEVSTAHEMSRALFEEGVFVSGFGYPVVPKGEARLRAQISAAHGRADLDFALEAFKKVGKRINVI